VGAAGGVTARHLPVRPDIAKLGREAVELLEADPSLATIEGARHASEPAMRLIEQRAAEAGGPLD